MLEKIMNFVEKYDGMILTTFTMIMTMMWAWTAMVLSEEFNGTFVSYFPLLERILFIVQTVIITLLWERVYKKFKN